MTTSPEFVVRPARPRDAASFLAMWRGVVAEGRFVRPDEVRGSVRDFRRQFRDAWTRERAEIVAVDGERVIGHLSIGREGGSVTRHIASIGMSVAADRRGTGVGSALLDAAIRWGREMGIEKLALSVYPHNDAARALYRKFGFTEEGRLSGHSKKAVGYLDEIPMGLWLIPPPR